MCTQLKQRIRQEVLHVFSEFMLAHVVLHTLFPYEDMYALVTTCGDPERTCHQNTPQSAQRVDQTLRRWPGGLLQLTQRCSAGSPGSAAPLAPPLPCMIRADDGPYSK